jgi:hypothetical protein
MKRFQMLAMLGAGLAATGALFAQEHAKSPADGYNIHVLSPHRHEDGSVHGPYHHYCKAITPEVMQCMVFMSTDPNGDVSFPTAISHQPVQTLVILD